MTTYTLDFGSHIERSLTGEQAALEILTHDGHLYEVRRDAKAGIVGAPAWRLFVSDGSVNGPGGAGALRQAWTGTGSNARTITAYAASEAAAWPFLAADVLTAGWRGGPSVYTDHDYDALLAELAAEEA
jgi:hypothetical protein